MNPGSLIVFRQLLMSCLHPHGQSTLTRIISMLQPAGMGKERKWRAKNSFLKDFYTTFAIFLLGRI